MEETQNSKNTMKVEARRTSDKKVQVSVELWSEKADTAYVTIDENGGETAALENGHVKLELALADENTPPIHTVTAELFKGDELTPEGALQETFTL